MEERFTFKQFFDDVKSNSRILSDGYLGLKGGKSIYYYISDDDEVNAKARRTDDKQYCIKVNVGLLKSFYTYVDCNIRNFYVSYGVNNNLSEEAFVRLVAGTMSEMIFWHEYAHIARGHFEYLDGVDKKGGSELECRRNVEVDADIYGASFLFVRIYSIYQGGKSAYDLKTLMQAYSIGIRAVFEVLHRNNEIEDFLHKESQHPHSLLRAYTAITHGLSNQAVSQLPSYIAAECTDIALRELLVFESVGSPSVVDVDMLRECVKTEWKFWLEKKYQLDSYMIMEIKKVSLIRRLKDFFVGLSSGTTC